LEREIRNIDRTIGTDEYSILNSVLSQLAQFNPEKVFLFGSFATNSFKAGTSDIDLCVVAETEDKRETLAKMYTGLLTSFISWQFLTHSS